MIKFLSLFLAVFLLAGCANNSEKSVLDRIEFGEDEYGCARVTGMIDTSASVFASANASVTVLKKKRDPENPEDDPPEC